VTTFDGRAADHMMKFPRLSPSVFAYCKRSKTGAIEGLGTRLRLSTSWWMQTESAKVSKRSE